jgi:hypothetical protein
VKERQIAPHIPVFDKSHCTDGTFSRSAFMFDPDVDHYTCPGDKRLVQYRRGFALPRTGITKDGTRPYHSSRSDCQSCDLSPAVAPSTLSMSALAFIGAKFVHTDQDFIPHRF